LDLCPYFVEVLTKWLTYSIYLMFNLHHSSFIVDTNPTKPFGFYHQILFLTIFAIIFSFTSWLHVS